MDTKKDSAVSDVPTFKVARVGNDRKRKGAGFSFLRGGGARGTWNGALGGSGAGGFGGAGGLAGAFGMSFTKAILMIAAVGGLTSAAVLVGSMGGSGGDAGKKQAIFSGKGDIKLEGDTSNLPSNPNSIPNSLGYLTGSRDGLTPEERAKKEADAAAAAEAQRLADEEAAKKAEAENTAGNAVDPNAMLASAQADGGRGGRSGGFDKKFGSLSSSFGGGSALSGGAGLSGGVNRSFGSSGGVKKGAGGQMSAMKGGARPTTSKSARAAPSKSNTKGFARRQLANANALSRRASAAGKAENAAADAGSAFDNNQGAGNVISGPGVGSGAGQSSGGGVSPNPGGGGGGGSLGTTPTDCGADHYQTADGTCELIPIEGDYTDKAVHQMCQLAMALLAAIAVISLIKAVVEKSFVASAFGPVLGALIGVMGLMITGLGLAIMGMGDYMQGTVLTLTGGFIAAVAFMPGAESILTSGTMLIASAAGMVLSQVASMIGPSDSKDKAPVAAQQ